MIIAQEGVSFGERKIKISCTITKGIGLNAWLLWGGFFFILIGKFWCFKYGI